MQVVEYQLDGYSFWVGELACSSRAYHVIKIILLYLIFIIINFII